MNGILYLLQCILLSFFVRKRITTICYLRFAVSYDFSDLIIVFFIFDRRTVLLPALSKALAPFSSSISRWLNVLWRAKIQISIISLLGFLFLII
jgi:hypothetical protein